MSGAIPPFPKYAFMAWCSVKAQLYTETESQRSPNNDISYQIQFYVSSVCTYIEANYPCT
jgi:hypothetical protein